MVTTLPAPVFVRFDMTDEERRELWRRAMQEASKMDASTSVAGRVNAIIAAVLDVDETAVLPTARLREKLGANEDDVWMLMLTLEDELDVDLEAAEDGVESTPSWMTVADVIEHCEIAVGKQHA